MLNLFMQKLFFFGCILSLKGKINAPPKDPDEQPVPRSLTQLFAFQNKNQDLVKKKEKKNCSTSRS